MRCRLCRYMWGLLSCRLCRYIWGLLSSRLCRYMWGINDIWAVYGVNERWDEQVYVGD